MTKSVQSVSRDDGNVVPFVAPGGSTEPGPSRPRTLRRVIKIGILSVGAVGLVVLLGLTGYLVYRNALKKQLRVGLRKVDAMIALDRPLAYEEADKALDRLNSKMPGELSVALRRAEVAAIRWGRFGASRTEGDRAKRLLAKLLVRSRQSERVQAIEALMALYSGERDKAAVLAERGLVHHPRSARLSYVLGMARLRNGELEAAEATLRLAVSYDSKYLPALYSLAVVERLRGRLDLASGYLERLLSVSPGHEGALVEQTLVRFLKTGRIDESALDRAAREAGHVPEYRARWLLVSALVAEKQGRTKDAADKLEEALRLRPDEPEYALALVDLETTRDVEAAGRVLLPKWRFLREYPNAALVTARLDLARGRVDHVLERLEDVRRVDLSDRERAEVEALEIRGMTLAGIWDRAEQQCRSKSKGGWTLSDPRLAACLHLAWIRGDRGLMRHFLRRLPPADRKSRLVGGLRSLARYRSLRAARRLSKVTGRDLAWTGLYAVRALMEAGRPRRAAELAIRVLDMRGRDVWARLLLAEAAAAAGRRKTASTQLRRVEKVLAPTSLYVGFQVGRIWLALRARRYVERLAKELSRKDGGRVWARWLSGLVAFSRGKWKQAKDNLAWVVRSEPTYWRAWMDFGRALYRFGDHKAAAKAFSEAATRGSRAEALFANLEEALRAGLVSEALEVGLPAARVFRRLGAWRRVSTIYASLADLMSRQESYNRRKVKRMFRKALDMRSVSSRAALLYAEFLRRRGRPEQALAWYERAVAANPESRDALYRRVWCMVHLPASAHRLEQAVDEFLAVEARGTRARRSRRWLKRAKALEARAKIARARSARGEARSKKASRRRRGRRK